MASGIIPDASQREQILDRYQSLLSEPNVVSLAVRVKPEPTLVVGVISAQGPAPVPTSVTVQVTDSAGRPAAVELATKIIAEGEITAHLAMAAAPGAPGAPGAPAVVRPVLGGRAIRTTALGSGTLGVNINYNGGYCLVSCAHVLTQYDPNNIGATIYQPAVIAVANALVTVTGQVPVTYYANAAQPHPVENVHDVATAAITPLLGDADIEMLGTPAGIRLPDPATDGSVDFYGAATGLQARQVTDFGVRYQSNTLDSGGQVIHTWWRDGIRYDNSVAGTAPGDSGAALVSDHDQHVIGLHRAGNATFGYGCPLL